MRRLLLDVPADRARRAFEACGHQVSDLDDGDLLEYAVAVMRVKSMTSFSMSLYSAGRARKGHRTVSRRVVNRKSPA